MRHIRLPLAILVLVAATSRQTAAQTVTKVDTDSARASITSCYGGRGLDWEASIDSPQLADHFRLRASVGQGRWVDGFESSPPAGTAPTVARLAADVIFVALSHVPPQGTGPRAWPVLRPYGGVGISVYLPRGVDMIPQRGVRIIAGMEGSGDRWTIGPEVQIDLPRTNTISRPHHGDDLLFTGRIGIAVRRRF